MDAAAGKGEGAAWAGGRCPEPWLDEMGFNLHPNPNQSAILEFCEFFEFCEWDFIIL